MKARHTNRLLTLGALVFSLLPQAVNAGPIPIDATNFTGDPAGKITFHPGGSATLAEDDFLGSTLLTNAPPFEPEVIIAAPGTFLSFDYDFTIGGSDFDDLFNVELLDTGLAIGSPFSFSTMAAGTGHVEWDLGALVGTSPLGIEFSLISGDFEFGSTVLVSNLRTFQAPLPATALLLLAGLLGMRVAGSHRLHGNA